MAFEFSLQDEVLDDYELLETLQDIDDGDYVVVEETQDVSNGDIVVALLDNGLATLKKYYREMTRIRLEPANSSMTPIYATNVHIQGRVVGLIRKFKY